MGEDFSVRLERHDAELRHVKARIENLEHDVYGNGREGMKTDMAVLRRDLQGAQRELRELVKRGAAQVKQDFSSHKVTLAVLALLSAAVGGAFQLVIEVVKYLSR